MFDRLPRVTPAAGRAALITLALTCGGAALAGEGPTGDADQPGHGLAYIAPLDQPPPAVTGLELADEELQAALLSWAVTLSGLPAPAHPPLLRRMPHEYFVQSACNGRECKVLGWYPPGDTVYVDERLDPLNNLLAASIVVHEMVHYLQYRAASQGLEYSCAQSIALERQAYGAQREFITRYGVYRPVGASMHQVGCEEAPTQTAASVH